MDGQKVITFPGFSHSRQQPAPPEPPPVGNEPAPPTGRFADLRSFGEFLRGHRESRRISLAQVSERIKVAASRLESLERGDISLLPAAIYRRAIVRSYASAVGLDPQEVVAEFVKLIAEQEAPVPVPDQVQEQPRLVHFHMPQTVVSVLAGVVLGASVATLLLWPPTPATQQQVVESEPAPAQAVVTEPAAAVAAVRLEVATSGDVQLASGDLPSPAPVPRAAENALRVTSNPSGARVTVNGIGWGATPLTIRHLPLGTKRIRLSKDGFRSAETTVTLAEDGPASVSLSLRPFDEG